MPRFRRRGLRGAGEPGGVPGAETQGERERGVVVGGARGEVCALHVQSRRGVAENRGADEGGHDQAGHALAVVGGADGDVSQVRPERRVQDSDGDDGRFRICEEEGSTERAAGGADRGAQGFLGRRRRQSRGEAAPEGGCGVDGEVPGGYGPIGGETSQGRAAVRAAGVLENHARESRRVRVWSQLFIGEGPRALQQVGRRLRKGCAHPVQTREDVRAVGHIHRRDRRLGADAVGRRQRRRRSQRARQGAHAAAHRDGRDRRGGVQGCGHRRDEHAAPHRPGAAPPRALRPAPLHPLARGPEGPDRDFASDDEEDAARARRRPRRDGDTAGGVHRRGHRRAVQGGRHGGAGGGHRHNAHPRAALRDVRREDEGVAAHA
mmetsp:Transcript_3752/g.14038  ORF Transcript_3752/g.14038 Transcript_3752/m.14038 type:complete len:378 (+) Transcript_3752:1639-2772(+)